MKKGNAYSVNVLMIPALVILAVLHAAVIFLIFGINSEGAALSNAMQISSSRISDVTSLLAGTSVLSETSSTFVMHPETEPGVTNYGPLVAYASELQLDRRSDDILARFNTKDVPEGAITMLRQAAENSDFLIERQLHAISLICVDHPLPKQPEVLSSIPLVALTGEEKSYSDDERQYKATNLISNQQYASNMQSLSQNVQGCVGMLQKIAGEQSAKVNSTMSAYRTWLWVNTFAIMGVLIALFIGLYRGIIDPLVKASKKINSDERLENKGLKEMRLLSTSYNELMDRRDSLDGMLREAAEKDVLTGLGNRYAFDQLVNTIMNEKDVNKTLTFVLFDVNFLKRTNDTRGHEAGDNLLKKAAKCIDAIFKNEDQTNTFRIGGDEFASILIGEDENKVLSMLEEFEEKQNKEGISISYGYSFSSQISEKPSRKMMEEADERMYKCKQRMHLNKA